MELIVELIRKYWENGGDGQQPKPSRPSLNSSPLDGAAATDFFMDRIWDQPMVSDKQIESAKHRQISGVQIGWKWEELNRRHYAT